jgi:site-specific DNA-methyltransferase (adenine-specific)
VHFIRQRQIRRNFDQPHAIFADITPPVQLFHGDCLTVLASLPEKSVDLVLTDLPSGVTACEWDLVIPLDKLWRELRRVAKDTTAFIFTATQPFTTRLIDSNLESFRYELIWEKPQGTNPLSAKKMPLKSHENIVVFYEKRPTCNPQMGEGVPYSGFETKNGATIGEVYGGSKSVHAPNLGTRYPKSVLRFKQDRSGLHPTQKPVPLMEYLIRTYSNEGDVVLDSCMGSGTTGIAAVNTKRRFIGIELDPEYFAVAEKRLEPKVNRHRPSGANRFNVISMKFGELLEEQSGVRASGHSYYAKGALRVVKRPVPTWFWACPRPKTHHWGSGQLWERICRFLGIPDAAFGKTDGIPDGIAYYDLSNGYDWKSLPLPDNHHAFGFWDPPYFNDDNTRFKMFKREAQEIWRVCKRLAILHPMIYPKSWFVGARREAMVAVTFGSLKMIRCLSVFTKEKS